VAARLDYASPHAERPAEIAPEANLALVWGSASVALQLMLWLGVFRNAAGLVAVAAAFFAAVAGTLNGIFGGFCHPRSRRGVLGFFLSLGALATFLGLVLYGITEC
jgi:hypothetical protein